jgi:hypothetical protein
MLDELKMVDVRRPALPELVELAAYGLLLLAEFEALGVESPEWIELNLKSIRREIKSRHADRIAEKLRTAKARLETLKTPDEKRASVIAEIAALEKQAAGQD